MKGWPRFAAFLLAGATIANIAGMACYLVLHGKVERVRQQLALTNGTRFPRFTGVDLQGSAWVSRDAPCRVIRITADDCSYCRQDKSSYERILSAAAEASCEVIEMAPRAGDMQYEPRPGVVQLKYIDADVGAVMYPFATPQTIVLDQQWSVRMNRRGAFNERSLADTIALLQSLAPNKVAQ